MSGGWDWDDMSWWQWLLFILGLPLIMLIGIIIKCPMWLKVIIFAFLGVGLIMSFILVWEFWLDEIFHFE